MRLHGFSVKPLGAAIFLSAFLAVAASTTGAETRHDVDIPSGTNGGDPLHGVLFTPDGAEPAHAIIVLHPGKGTMKQADINYARDLSKNGFVALAVNYQTNTKNNSPWHRRVTTDLNGVVNWLRARPEVSNKGVGTVGFSAGAAGLLLAAQSLEVSAVIVYYGGYNMRKYKGGNPKVQFPFDKAAVINAAVLMFHGEKDDEIPVQDAEEMRDAMKAAGKTVELVVYPGAYHRFDRGEVEGRSSNFRGNGFTYIEDSEAARDAFARTLAWLNAHLKKPTDVVSATAEPIGPTGLTASMTISKFDLDGDGKLTKSEWKGRPRVFGIMNKDKNDFVTKQEIDAHFRRLLNRRKTSGKKKN